ncbi:hypothetical protein [Janthinobacterium fluminis]|uniref:Elongation factor Tu n=1 Tax=Janthinobacterium fluminis TaxID=2987524 RepID=A0ABT5JX24_9BURK|nr:hypothetical protein [Janthinobacterium fluminis]MDC8756087.1 hypothetical protein [Janthinobacterium fluminis]
MTDLKLRCMGPIPQFTAELHFHFREHGSDRRRCFVFDESLHRRVPMKMEGVDGLNTIGMWVDAAGVLQAGDSVTVRCVVIAPELFADVVRPGVKFELWDGDFFASGDVIERIDAGWRSR